MTTTDHAIVAPAVTGDPGTRADAGGFDPGRAYATRDGRKVLGLRPMPISGFIGKVGGEEYQWWASGRYVSGKTHPLDLVNVGVRPAAPDPIPQPEGDAPPAPAQSAGAAADGEDDAAGLTQADIDHAQALLDDRRGTHQTLTMVRHMLDFILARRGARPHEPADASARSARGEVAEQDVLLFASYCGDDNPKCSEARPCPRCLGMSNVYRARIGAYVRQLSPDWNHDEASLVRACLFNTPAAVLDRARPAGQGEGGGWCPIATAPKDGTEVDLWIAPLSEDGYPLTPCRIPDAHFHCGDWLTWSGFAEVGHQKVKHRITHWRPLPAPPSAAAAPPAPASREDEERAQLQLIDQRDAAEDALSEAYQLVVGEPPQWSSMFHYQDALDNIRDVLDSRATSPPAHDAGPAGVTEAERVEAIKAARDHAFAGTITMRDERMIDAALDAAARARTPDAGKETGR